MVGDMQTRLYRTLKLTLRGSVVALSGLMLTTACGSDEADGPFADDDASVSAPDDEDEQGDENDVDVSDEDKDEDVEEQAPVKPGAGRPDAGPDKTPDKDGGGGPAKDADGDKDDADTATDPDGGTPGEDDDAGDDEGTPPVGSGESSCLDKVTDFGAKGPFEYEAKTHGPVKMWVPKVEAGCKVPVLHMANGTGGTCSAYINTLQAWASHGFLVTCYESTQTGAGTQGVQAFESALKEYPDLAAMKFGSAGHSQGGQSSYLVQRFAEEKWGSEAIYAGLAMQPASGFGSQPAGGTWQSHYAKIKSPMFMFSGTADSLVSAAWVKRGFDALDDSIEAYNWSARGATHVPTPQAETTEVGVPWFRWKLLGDDEACKAFKALKMGGRWSEVQVQNEKSCE